jgi:hypothetical protein
MGEWEMGKRGNFVSEGKSRELRSKGVKSEYM